MKICKKCAHKKVFTLSSLKYSISHGENLNLHMSFPIFAYHFQIFSPRYAFLQISVNKFESHIS
jgi:hypothetical protein